MALDAAWMGAWRLARRRKRQYLGRGTNRPRVELRLPGTGNRRIAGSADVVGRNLAVKKSGEYRCAFEAVWTGTGKALGWT